MTHHHAEMCLWLGCDWDVQDQNDTDAGTVNPDAGSKGDETPEGEGYPCTTN